MSWLYKILTLEEAGEKARGNSALDLQLSVNLKLFQNETTEFSRRSKARGSCQQDLLISPSVHHLEAGGFTEWRAGLVKPQCGASKETSLNRDEVLSGGC